MSPPYIFSPNRRQVVLGAASAATLVTAGSMAQMLTAPASAAATASLGMPKLGRFQSFDSGWRFRRGEGRGFEAPDLDDSGWRPVDLPHDWSIEDLPPPAPESKSHVIGPFDRKAEGDTATGFTVGGEGWYRKRFGLAVPAGGRAEILFDGVYMNSDVWVNGHHLGAHPNGYTPFAYDLTPYLLPTGDNVLVVRVRNLGRNSRWYSGSGIHRHVFLDVFHEPSRIARWGVSIATRRIANGTAELEIATRLEEGTEGLTLVSRVKDREGHTLGESTAPAQTPLRQEITLRSPQLWSPDAPSLYVLETELRRGSAVVDRMVTPFGVRIITFDAAQGMTINGTPVKLRGGCIHHDNGLLGAAAFDGAEERKVMRLKARGFNAVRPSHNLFSPAFLQACDRHGLLVIAETFDAWREPKLPDDYSVDFDAQWHSDLTTIVASTRNHPSIIMWSIGNEIPGRNLPIGVETQWQLANAVHALDPTRPVTAAVNDFPGRSVIASPNTARPGRAGVPDQTSVVFLDVVGYNYKLSDYERDHQQFPNRILFGSESFAKEVYAIWELAEKSPYLLGDFVWTAIDYLGEAGIGGSSYLPASTAGVSASPGAWPWVVAGCGDIDLIGNQKPASLARDVVWGLSPLEMAVQRPVPDGKIEVLRPWGWSDESQSWTWPDALGKPLSVRVYTTCDRVELRLNGHMIDSKPVSAADRKHIEFSVTYAPGMLEAVGFRAGKEIARRSLTTAGPAAEVRLVPEAKAGGAGRGDVSFVAIEIVDGHGHRVPDLAAPLQISISGPADLLGFGSANPFASSGFQSASAQTWDGRALAILRGTGKTGQVHVEVLCQGLKGGSVSLRLA
jgi:beta-galactosidase